MIGSPLGTWTSKSVIWNSTTSHHKAISRWRRMGMGGGFTPRSMPGMGMRRGFTPQSMGRMPMHRGPMMNSPSGFQRFGNRDFNRNDRFGRFNRFNHFDRDHRFDHFNRFNHFNH